MRKLLLLIPVLLTACATSVPVERKFPDAPQDLLVACPSLEKVSDTDKLSDVLKTVTDNYSEYQECKLKTDTWIDWYKTQKQIFESVK